MSILLLSIILLHQVYHHSNKLIIEPISYNIVHYFVQDTHNITEWHVKSRFGDEYTESILQICNLDHSDAGEYSCVASIGTTVITDSPINVTLLPGMFTYIYNQLSQLL